MKIEFCMLIGLTLTACKAADKADANLNSKELSSDITKIDLSTFAGTFDFVGPKEAISSENRRRNGTLEADILVTADNAILLNTKFYRDLGQGAGIQVPGHIFVATVDGKTRTKTETQTVSNGFFSKALQQKSQATASLQGNTVKKIETIYSRSDEPEWTLDKKIITTLQLNGDDLVFQEQVESNEALGTKTKILSTPYTSA